MLTTRRCVLASSSLLAFAATARSFPAIAQTGSPAAGAQTAGSEQEAHALGVDAYLYFYPLITMDLTRKQMTNFEAGKEIGKGPMNTFNSVPAYPPADYKVVVRSELRYAVFSSMARPDQGTCNRFGTGYGWPLLSPAHA